MFQVSSLRISSKCYFFFFLISFDASKVVLRFDFFFSSRHFFSSSILSGEHLFFFFIFSLKRAFALLGLFNFQWVLHVCFEFSFFANASDSFFLFCLLALILFLIKKFFSTVSRLFISFNFYSRTSHKKLILR